MIEDFCPMCGCQIGCFASDHHRHDISSDPFNNKLSKEGVCSCPGQLPKILCDGSSGDDLILLQELKNRLQQLIGFEVEFLLKNNEKLRGEVRSVGENFVEILVKDKEALLNDYNEDNSCVIDNDK
ncbi:hypothetical protein GCM10010954_11480 [Halobacillus andaensis]|uniref:Uncharacterized protein n=1 Tax=Halobacillus andaensis TaxID=1176239 RepID=A0A917B2V4_HALAA|nr:hypothetical protein [Halobacillus andaensis]MBP2003944.1 small nuclear ribonucleoprotein (snRNP)-like protein [Halobacillus andaensis]GGF14568.1 hypothetical protein GCM10010954_11480 [Halobacillus andaensis]